MSPKLSNLPYVTLEAKVLGSEASATGCASRSVRFTKKFATVPQKVVVGQPLSAVSLEELGYANWVIVSIHALREYLNRTYR